MTTEVRADEKPTIKVDFNHFDPDHISILKLDPKEAGQVKSRKIEIGAQIWAYDDDTDQRVVAKVHKDEDGAIYLHCYLGTMEHVNVSRPPSSEDPMDFGDSALKGVVRDYVDSIATEFRFLQEGLLLPGEHNVSIEELAERRKNETIEAISSRLSRIDAATTASDEQKARKKMEYIETLIFHVHAASNRKCNPVGYGDVIDGRLYKQYVVEDGEDKRIERYSIQI